MLDEEHFLGDKPRNNCCVRGLNSLPSKSKCCSLENQVKMPVFVSATMVSIDSFETASLIVAIRCEIWEL